jgi:NDP-sugar pyrophosphorylase family protein
MSVGNVRAAMILCAGRGTRLLPLTSLLAKPMVPVGDRPAVAHVLAQVQRISPERVVVNVHHRHEDVAQWAADAGAVAVSYEPELLGTAGGVACARELLGNGAVLVWNGDILSPFDPADLVRLHDTRRPYATLAVVPRPALEGNVGFDAQGAVVRLRTERFGEEASGGYFLGISVLSPQLRAELPTSGCLVGDVWLPHLRARRSARIAVHTTHAPFIDVGSVEQYLAANRAWLNERSLSSWVAPDAWIAGSGAEVAAWTQGSVIGGGARIDAPALRCVVWPGAHVSEPVTDAVVTRQGITRANR